MRRSRLIASLAIVLAAVMVAAFSRPPQPAPRTQEGPILPRKEVLRVLGASQLPLLADYYWLRTVQQTGIARTEEEYRDIAFFGDLSTDLDPRFQYVYEWSGVSTPFNRGREEWVNADLAERMLRKGIAQYPGDERMLFHLGYNLMAYQKRFREAGEVFIGFAGIPGAPAHIPRLGTRLLAASGDLDASRQATLLMRDFAADDEEREFYELRLLEIEREHELKKIDGAVALYRERKGAPPQDFESLHQEGLLTEVRSDPLGGRYFLDLKGTARSTSGAFRLEPYTQSKKRELREALPTEHQ